MKTREIQITLPNKLDDFKIKHVTYLTGLATDVKEVEGVQVTTLNKCKHLANYSGLDIELIKSANPIDINKAFNHILKIVATYKPGEVAKTVNILGEKYDLIDLTKQTGGWLIDFESQRDELMNKPEILAALCYVERGKKYGDIKTSERAEIFYDEFKAIDYINLTGFFLQKFESFIKDTGLTITTIATKEMKRARTKQKLKRDLAKIRLSLLPK
jgi:hypothetical protein